MAACKECASCTPVKTAPTSSTNRHARICHAPEHRAFSSNTPLSRRYESARTPAQVWRPSVDAAEDAALFVRNPCGRKARRVGRGVEHPFFSAVQLGHLTAEFGGTRLQNSAILMSGSRLPLNEKQTNTSVTHVRSKCLSRLGKVVTKTMLARPTLRCCCNRILPD